MCLAGPLPPHEEKMLTQYQLTYQAQAAHVAQAADPGSALVAESDELKMKRFNVLRDWADAK